MSTTLITTQTDLKQLCQQLQDSDWLTLDTEFIREKTYYPQLCLIQIANQQQSACIDPLALDSLEPLLDLLHNENIIKVFHAADQDLEIFYLLSQTLPKPVFDTQLAAALLGYGEQIGYAALVKTILNVELDKSSSRTDWQQRPLDEQQIEYALNDVKYLAQLYPAIINELEDKNRLDWALDEMSGLNNPASYQTDPMTCWQRVKGANKLRPQQLNVLKHLAHWREQRAAQLNKPRRWIMNDDVLLNLAIQRPTKADRLNRVRQLDKKVIEQCGETLLTLIQNALQENESTWPTPNRGRKPSINEEALMDMLTTVIRIKAAENQLSPGQLCSRGDLFRLIQGEKTLPLLQGWRRDVAGNAALETLAGKLQIRVEEDQATLVKV